MANYYVYKGPTLGVVLSATTASGTDLIRVTGFPDGEEFVPTLPSGCFYIIDNGPTYGLAYSTT